jgi:hypothetical protein
VANCLGANFVGAIDLALVTSLRRLDASTCRVYRLRAEVVRHGWMGYGGTVLRSRGITTSLYIITTSLYIGMSHQIWCVRASPPGTGARVALRLR